MFTLYHHGSSVCAAKVRFAMAEKGLEWDGVYIDILNGDQFKPEYLKINPKAVVHNTRVRLTVAVTCRLSSAQNHDAAERPAATVVRPASDNVQPILETPDPKIRNLRRTF